MWGIFWTALTAYNSVNTMKRKTLKYPTSIHDFGPFLKKQKLLDSFAEIGVAEGRSSLEFMNWGFKKCYLVDRWEHLNQLGDGFQPQEWHDDNLQTCQENLKKFGSKINILKGDSVDMASRVDDMSLSFVYLDANHEYSAVFFFS